MLPTQASPLQSAGVLHSRLQWVVPSGRPRHASQLVVLHGAPTATRHTCAKVLQLREAQSLSRMHAAPTGPGGMQPTSRTQWSAAFAQPQSRQWVPSAKTQSVETPSTHV